MDEESSFYMLHSLVKNYGFEGLYKEGFPDLKKKILCFIKFREKIYLKI
jgi:hypothetical protein